MKGKLVGKNKIFFYKSGFSTLELMIAFALISIVLVGAVGANFSAQYWSITSETSNEALYKAKTKLEDLRSLIKQDFYSVVSTPLTVSADPTDPADASCIAGGLCYSVQSTVTDVSSCSKYVEALVQWKVDNYPITSVKLGTNLTNSTEIINRGGDCVLNEPNGDWKNSGAQTVGQLSFAPGKQFTGIDVLQKKIYVTSGLSPSLLIYDIPTAVGQNPVLDKSLDITIGGVSKTFNGLDTEEDLATGRTYIFLALNATTSQLVVVDATDAHNPTVIAQRNLQTTDPFGSFPQGWRVFIYGGRLYMTTRETSGPELHIFDITTPTLPTEIGNGVELNRTVNDIVVRDQKVGNVTHRFMFLASDSAIKELGVFDVTNDVVTEVNSVDLPGIYDTYSLYLLGNNLYLGRASNPTGPELYVFSVTNPSVSLPIVGQGEVGADVTSIKVTGKYDFIGTGKVGEEFQTWDSDFTPWNPTVLNSGRFKSYSIPNLAPLGFDIDTNWIYTITKSLANDMIKVIYTP